MLRPEFGTTPTRPRIGDVATLTAEVVAVLAAHQDVSVTASRESERLEARCSCGETLGARPLPATWWIADAHRAHIAAAVVARIEGVAA